MVHYIQNYVKSKVGQFTKGLMAFLDEGGVEGNKVEGGRISKITLFGYFLREEGRRFGGV